MGTSDLPWLQDDQPLLRGANADVNLTLAMALVFFACWIYWVLERLAQWDF
jgi:F0F1-type ATP synthase membrane subunit a